MWVFWVLGFFMLIGFLTVVFGLLALLFGRRDDELEYRPARYYETVEDMERDEIFVDTRQVHLHNHNDIKPKKK